MMSLLFKRNYIREMKKWPQLLVDIEKLIDAEVTPDSDGAKHLAQQWLSMLQGYTGKTQVLKKNPYSNAK